VPVRGVFTDTRAPLAGALFVALKGEQFDAHNFAAQALAGGAAAALVERALPVDLPQVVVADTQLALGDLASAVRAQRRARVVGITGSNGKTSVKTLLASILALRGRTHVNPGNLNNEIGLPLSLLALPEDADYAVFEMGAGKPGDIAYLTSIVRPHIALVNNIAPAHLERMGSLLGVAETKGAIYEALSDDGVAVINADDTFAPYFAQIVGHRRNFRFGIDNDADVRASKIRAVADGSHFTLTTPAGDAEIALPLPGRHNVMNALAATAMALGAGAPLTAIVEGLRNAEPVKGRQIAHTLANGAVLIDDSYNANPGSVAAAIATLAQHGNAWLVLGDMAELGEGAPQLHAEIGALAKRAGVQRLFTLGPLSAEASRAFGANAKHYDQQQALIDALRNELAAGVHCLIKGSRSSAMDKVVTALLKQEPQGHGHAA